MDVACESRPRDSQNHRKEGDGTHVPKFWYQRTRVQQPPETLAIGAGSTEILVQYPRCTIGADTYSRESSLRNMQFITRLRG